MSLEAYDRLMVQTSEIVTYGQLSDTVRYNIADITLSILPSGRLGISRDQFDEAREAFLLVQAHGEIGRAVRKFRRYWRTKDRPAGDADVINEVDEATRVEFGFSLSEIIQFLAQCLSLGIDANPVVGCMRVAAFQELLSDAFYWLASAAGTEDARRVISQHTTDLLSHPQAI